jgi:hypothetical protein
MIARRVDAQFIRVILQPADGGATIGHGLQRRGAESSARAVVRRDAQPIPIFAAAFAQPAERSGVPALQPPPKKKTKVDRLSVADQPSGLKTKSRMGSGFRSR